MSECIILLLGLGALLTCSDALKLELASVIFRHGDRSPTHTYPNDPYQESYWPQGFGQLSTEGMRQEYFLGEVLKARYVEEKKLIFANYTRTQQYELLYGAYSKVYDFTFHFVKVYVRSTDYDRTLMSGESLLAALFLPSDNQVFKENLSWQPIPVHTVPTGEDYLLRAYTNCPTYSNLLLEDTQTPAYMNLNKENQDFFKSLEVNTGLELVDLTSIPSLYGTLNIERLNNLRLPKWANAMVMSRMLNLTLYTKSLYFNTKTKQRLTAGNWIGKALDDMKTRTMEPNNEMRLYLYSAHDTGVMAMMTALGVFNGIPPPYAATFSIELYSNANRDYFVSLFYRNETYGSYFRPLPVGSCMNTTLCSLQEFINLFDHLVSSDWERECGLNTQETIPETILLLFAVGLQAFVVVALLAVCFVILICICYKRCKREPQYIRVHRPHKF